MTSVIRALSSLTFYFEESRRLKSTLLIFQLKTSLNEFLSCLDSCIRMPWFTSSVDS